MSNSPSTFLPYLVYVPGTTINELKDGKLLHCLFAELIGTVFLVLIGCGSCLGHGYLCPPAKDLDMKEANVDIVRIAFAFGLVVATLAQSIGHISGCHINPAVTVGLVTGRKMGVVKGSLYIVLQCVGALIGAGILQVFSLASCLILINL